MLLALFKLLFKSNGWKVVSKLPKGVNRCILLAGPHTSNWDTVYALAAMDQLGVKAQFALKKELMFWPFRPFLKGVGAIAIDRNPKQGENRISAVDAMSQLFEVNDELMLMISPEGTRSPVKKWKTGFYYVAQKANVPLVCSFLNYKTKTAGIGPVFSADRPLEEVMKDVMTFYASKTPKFPEKFITTLD